MGGLPIHPVVVHFPLVFAIVLPITALVALWWIGRPAHSGRAWLIPLTLSGVLALSAFVALRTGEAEEERVERVVAESVLHRHEEAAERFLWLCGALLIVAAAGLSRRRVGRTARTVATIGSFGVALAAIQVGAAGGELVYREGAASAYTDAVNKMPTAEDIEH